MSHVPNRISIDVAALSAPDVLPLRSHGPGFEAVALRVPGTLDGDAVTVEFRHSSPVGPGRERERPHRTVRVLMPDGEGTRHGWVWEARCTLGAMRRARLRTAGEGLLEALAASGAADPSEVVRATFGLLGLAAGSDALPAGSERPPREVLDPGPGRPDRGMATLH